MDCKVLTSRRWKESRPNLISGLCLLVWLIAYSHSHNIQSIENISGEEVVRRHSPTFAINAIQAHLIIWRTVFVNIVTEKKFKIIAHQWLSQLQTYVNTVHLNIWHSGFGQIKYKGAWPCSELYSATIILMESSTLSSFLGDNMVTDVFQMDSICSNVIIVGKCMPNVIARYPADVHSKITILPAPVLEWIHGHNIPFQNAVLYSIQRISKTMYSAIPFRNMHKNGTLSRNLNPHQYHGYMKDKVIFVGYNQYQTTITSCTDNKVSQFGGDYINSLQGYLKFRIECRRYYVQGSYQGKLPLNGTTAPDIYLFTSSTFFAATLSELFYPPFFTDYIAFFVRNNDETITMTDLIHLIGSTIWICFFVSIIFINTCFLFVYYYSPNLQRNRKVRTKPMSKIVNILSLHGIAFFQSEWQQGPTTSSKCNLLAYNIFFFIFSNIYLTLFTNKIFSLKKLTPFDVQQIPNSIFIYSGTFEFFLHLVSPYCPMSILYDEPSCQCLSDALRNVRFDNVTILFGELKHSNWTAIVEVASVALPQLRAFPEIGPVREVIMKYPFSFKSRAEFVFLEIFYAITMKMKETGSMNKLIKTHFNLKFVPESVLNPVHFALIWYMLVILGIGILISLITCSVEKIIWKMCESK